MSNKKRDKDDNTVDYLGIAQRIKQIIQESNTKNMKNAAEMSGIKYNSLTDVVSGRTNCTIPILVAIANTFNYSMRWITTGEGDKQVESASKAFNEESALDDFIMIVDYIDKKENLNMDSREKVKLIKNIYNKWLEED